MDQESYQIGFKDALLAMEYAIEEHMAYWHLHPARFMAEQLMRRIRTLQKERFDPW